LLWEKIMFSLAKPVQDYKVPVIQRRLARWLLSSDRGFDMNMSGTRNTPIVPVGEAPTFHEFNFRPRVLVVDDETSIADTTATILSMSGYEAIAAYDGNDALEAALLSPPHLLITDVVMPGMNGIELAITIQRVFPDCQILLFSGQASTVDLLAAAGSAARRFTLLSKPLPPECLLATVKEKLRPVARRSVSSAN
jgi:CheY-like chemotaxis protein